MHLRAALTTGATAADVRCPSYSHGMRHDDSTHPLHPMNPFEVMAEPVRRRIIDILASGEHTAGEVAAVVGFEFRISRTAVSKHLRILRDAGFVHVRGDFQWRWYQLTSDGIDVLEEAVAGIRRKWETRVGYDAELGGQVDPLVAFERPVRRKGPGREPRRGRRGTQTSAPVASEPDLGWRRGS
jgi:DNA-binding transcriptional ArsR family regulator